MKILMVCLGNICRSPLAHGIMEDLIKEKQLNWTIDSAGTGNWHAGNEPDKRSVTIAKQQGIDIQTQRARQITKDDFDAFDWIIVMDKQNYEDVCKISTKEEHLKKVRLLIPDEIVPDPYWDDKQFDPVFHLIKKGCSNLLEELIR